MADPLRRSGEGIQKRYPPHAGRLIQQYTVVIGSEFKAVSVYSDDHGVTWQAGEPFGAGMDENKVVELSDGRLMVNSRASTYGAPGVKARRIAISEDGGQTYGPTTVDSTLIDPNNNAGLTRAYPEAPKDSFKAKMLLFTNTASTTGRANGTVRLSMDDGATWAKSKLFRSGGMQYSTITPYRDENGTPIDGVYGILYEYPGSGISFMRVSMDWLGLPKLAISGEPRDVQRGGNWLAFTVSNISDAATPAGTLTPEAIPGWTWETPSVEVPALQAGETATVYAKARIGATQGAGNVAVRASLALPGESEAVVGGFNVTAVLTGSQFEATCSTDVNLAPGQNLPEQIATEESRAIFMLDPDLSKFWHTPWNQTMTFPFSFDLTIPVSDALKELQLIKRPSGPNGVITSATVSLVQGDTVTALATDFNPDTQTVPMDAVKEAIASGETATIRVTVNSTDGDSVANRNKWISLAHACFRLVDNSPITYDEPHPDAAPTEVTPAAVVIDNEALTYTIPSVEGVEYVIDGQVVEAGTHTATVGQELTVHARAASDSFVIADGAQVLWQHFFTKEVTPVAPVIDNDALTYTVPSVQGLQYFVNGEPVAAGVVAAEVGDEVEIHAEPTVGYTFPDTVEAYWEHTFTKQVTPAAVVFDNDALTYTVPAVEGVRYTVGGTVVEAGPHSATVDQQVIVTAEASAAGYVFPAGAQTSWQHTFTAIPLVAVTPAAVDFDNDALTYSVPAVDGVAYVKVGAGAVDPADALAAGQHSATIGEAVTIVAVALDGYVLADGVASTWSHTFTKLVVPATVVFDNDGLTYRIPILDGVEYLVGGEVVAGGERSASIGETVTVSARPTAGYVFRDGQENTWSHTFTGTTDPITPERKITLSTTDIVPGATFTITGTGFAPDTEIRGTIYSDPFELGKAKADADGRVSFTVTLPLTFPTGDHTIVLVEVGSSKKAELKFKVSPAKPVDTNTAGSSTGAGSGSGNSVKRGLAKTGVDAQSLALMILCMGAVGLSMTALARRKS